MTGRSSRTARTISVFDSDPESSLSMSAKASRAAFKKFAVNSSISLRKASALASRIARLCSNFFWRALAMASSLRGKR